MYDSSKENETTLKRLAAEVLGIYGITPVDIKLIQGGSIKTVWKVRTDKSVLCLKRLKQTMDKALFSVNAQIHVKKSGGFVPGVIGDKNGQVIVNHKEQLFVLYEWIDGRDLNFQNQADLCMAVKGLADFHIATKGYIPVDGSRISSKVGRWPDQYLSMKRRMSEWDGYDAAVDSMAAKALEMLKSSEYGRMTGDSGSDVIVLCHQDYGRGNAILADKSLYVIDLDGVTFDLPARDIRKIIGKNAENNGRWQPSKIKEILDWYTEVNPMSMEEKNVLFIDLMFPHWYFGLVKNLFQGGKQVKKSEIDRMARFEADKVPVIQELIDNLSRE